jgi:hypothetical protein
MKFLTKLKLRHKRATLEGLVNRYGNITLMDAHDYVSVELDYFRGSCVKRKKEKGNIENVNIDKEFQSWLSSS